MSKTPTPKYTSPPENESGLPLLPVETEIYILPTGEVVIADLPAELAAAILPWPADDSSLNADCPDAKDPPHGR